MQPLLRNYSAALFLFVHAVLLSGCGGDVDTISVSGKATFHGQPLAGGNVAFFPQKGHPINAAIDSAGTYTVEVPPGEYRVALQAKGIEVPPGWKEGDPLPPPPKLVLPAKYSSGTQTQLTLTVAPGGEPLTKDFELQ